jgi:hypothetical protein
VIDEEGGRKARRAWKRAVIPVWLVGLSGLIRARGLLFAGVLLAPLAVPYAVYVLIRYWRMGTVRFVVLAAGVVLTTIVCLYAVKVVGTILSWHS